jgi:Squalene-hopene cyclase C-terminal domain/Prenyltransferase and squalene oxidase repeat
MKYAVVFALLTLLGCAAILAQTGSGQVGKEEKPVVTQQTTSSAMTSPEISVAIGKGAKWLASVQGADGGWGQDGGAASDVRQNERLESKGNDVANTAVAALALLRAGDQYRPNVERAVDFILKKIEASPNDGLSITDVNQTQIQRKLGPFIDTFLASMLLARVDGTLAKANNARVRKGLEKCVAKIERNQLSDGSWNIAGGWAPVLGTSLASQGLYMASKKGVQVNEEVLARADDYTVNNQKGRGSAGLGSVGGVGAGVGPGSAPGGAGARAAIETADAPISSEIPVREKGRQQIQLNGGTSAITKSGAISAAAGVDLYQSAQAIEQLSRTPEAREKNKTEIAAISAKLSDARFVEGYGSIGGEEFFSYLNISDSLKRTGGKEWGDWHSKITQKILKLQNNDGTWAGHHCITGRVAVTSAAILNLTSDREN